MESIFKHYTLGSFLASVREERGMSLKEISAYVGITPQAVGLIFNGEERLVLNHLSGWKKAFRFKRLPGMYFELLSIFAAFPTALDQERLKTRALALAQHLVLHPELKEPAPALIVYWLSPECTLLRNMVDLHDFPVEGQDVSAYASAHLRRYRQSRGFSENEATKRFEAAWKWLVVQGVIVRDEASGRFCKTTPTFAAPNVLEPVLNEFATVLFSIPHADGLFELATQMGTPAILASKVATMPLPSAVLPTFSALVNSFAVKVVRHLNVACNADELARLKESDAETYAEALAFRQGLERIGMELPLLHYQDIDSMAQLAVCLRRLDD